LGRSLRPAGSRYCRAPSAGRRRRIRLTCDAMTTAYLRRWQRHHDRVRQRTTSPLLPVPALCTMDHALDGRLVRRSSGLT
jgi:hypothetical protein